MHDRSLFMGRNIPDASQGQGPTVWLDQQVLALQTVENIDEALSGVKQRHYAGDLWRECQE